MQCAAMADVLGLTVGIRDEKGAGLHRWSGNQLHVGDDAHSNTATFTQPWPGPSFFLFFL